MTFLLISWLIGVCAFDFAQRRVPNHWVLIGLGLALIALVGHASPVDLGWHEALTGGGIAFVALLGFYAMGMMGAGDVKFAGVLGLWLGGPALVSIAVGAGLLAGGHALVWLARHRGLSPGRRRTAGGDIGAESAVVDALAPRVAMTVAIPYAGYLALVALSWVASGTVPAAP